MKLLRADSGSGFFLDESGAYKKIDEINKVELLRLVDLTLNEDVEFDEYDEAVIQNTAHRIIYKSISEKLSGLQERKQQFVDESQRTFHIDYEKYGGGQASTPSSDESGEIESETDTDTDAV